MKTFNCDRSYDKLNKDVKRNIDIGIKKLRDRMNAYINQNKTIENICGDNKNSYMMYIQLMNIDSMCINVGYVLYN